jgi:hypothetical protein
VHVVSCMGCRFSSNAGVQKKRYCIKTCACRLSRGIVERYYGKSARIRGAQKKRLRTTSGTIEIVDTTIVPIYITAIECVYEKSRRRNPHKPQTTNTRELPQSKIAYLYLQTRHSYSQILANKTTTLCIYSYTTLKHARQTKEKHPTTFTPPAHPPITA